MIKLLLCTIFYIIIGQFILIIKYFLTSCFKTAYNNRSSHYASREFVQFTVSSSLSRFNDIGLTRFVRPSPPPKKKRFIIQMHPNHLWERFNCHACEKIARVRVLHATCMPCILARRGGPLFPRRYASFITSFRPLGTAAN